MLLIICYGVIVTNWVEGCKENAQIHYSNAFYYLHGFALWKNTRENREII